MLNMVNFVADAIALTTKSHQSEENTLLSLRTRASGEAIQFHSKLRIVDCFAALAMTGFTGRYRPNPR